MTARLTSRLPQIIAQLPGATDEALKQGADAVAEGAKERVPVSTGALRNAIHVEEAEGGYSVVAGDGDAFYGHMVEYGTTNAPAHPFLIPSYEAAKEGILEGVEDALEEL